MSEKLFIGTSGWSYQHWKETFYHSTPPKDWLRYYSEKFNSVEINGTFYRLQSAETIKKWFYSTPENFRFSLKAHRYLTHSKKLIDPEAAIIIERDHAFYLGEKLAVVLWQLPVNFSINIERLKCFITGLALWQEVRHVVEFRHSSWFVPQVRDLLQYNHIAICQSDSADWPMWADASSDIVYARLHGHSETYVSPYSNNSLTQWSKKIKSWQQKGKIVFVYFDNDTNAHAPKNALTLRSMISE